MQRSTEPPALKRFLSGERCEVTGCYEEAVWSASADQKAFHWCVKHTRMEMRDGERWGTPVAPTLDS